MACLNAGEKKTQKEIAEAAGVTGVTIRKRFRDTLDKIRNVAKREKTTPNGLVNNILESYIQWELNAPQAGWALMPKRFLIELIKEY